MSPVALSVAVAVMNCPTGTFEAGEKAEAESDSAWPCLLVVTCICPRKVLPSPKSEESFEGLLRNWRMKVLFFSLVLGVLSSFQPMVVKSPPVCATAHPPNE